MTAPDPTAGEGCGHRGYPHCDGKRPCACPCHDASPPAVAAPCMDLWCPDPQQRCATCPKRRAVAASTGASEDDERMAWCLCSDFGPIMPGDTHERRCSDLWSRLAAHDAATADRARRETAEKIAAAIEAKCDHVRGRICAWCVHAARIVREQAR